MTKTTFSWSVVERFDGELDGPEKQALYFSTYCLKSFIRVVKKAISVSLPVGASTGLGLGAGAGAGAGVGSGLRSASGAGDVFALSCVSLSQPPQVQHGMTLKNRDSCGISISSSSRKRLTMTKDKRESTPLSAKLVSSVKSSIATPLSSEIIARAR